MKFDSSRCLCIALTSLCLVTCGAPEAIPQPETQQTSVRQEAFVATEKALFRAAVASEFDAAELARLAEHRAKTPRVLQFATQMRQRHQNAYKQAAHLGRALVLPVPTAMSAVAQARWTQWFNTTGVAFEESFLGAHRSMSSSASQAIHRLLEASPYAAVHAWSEEALEGWKQDTEMLQNWLAQP